jgi:glycosyltransferase involved in cell wall biosynthesis
MRETRSALAVVTREARSDDVPAPAERRRVLVSCDHYLPGANAGGPIRSISAIVGALGDALDFRIVTRDRDLGATTPYPDVIAGTWTEHAGTPVHYCPEGAPTAATWQAAIDAVRPDVVYLNSLLSPAFSIAPLLLRRRGRARGPRFVLAPRGELHPGALAIRRWKKETFLRLARAGGLLRGIAWHATAAEEAEQIRRWFGRDALITVAPVLASPAAAHDQPPRARKRRGVLDVAFLSRISPKKNLLGAIELLRDLPGEVRFHLYGPKEDAAYWELCRAALDRLPANVTLHDHGALAGDQVGAALAQNHVFLFPTHGENFGHVILEALLAGVPALISDQTPWRDLERDDAGWELPLARGDAFRARLAALVEMDELEHARWSRGARRLGLRYAHDEGALASNRALFAASAS